MSHLDTTYNRFDHHTDSADNGHSSPAPLAAHPGFDIPAGLLGSANCNANNGLNMGLLLAVLDLVDYGLAVVNAETHQVVHANLHAQNALHPSNVQVTGLCVSQGLLTARSEAQADQLSAALSRTKARVRTLLRLAEPVSVEKDGQGHSPSHTPSHDSASEPMSIAVIPLAGSQSATPDPLASTSTTQVPAGATPPSYALLVFAKQQLCDTTTVTLFARERGLTGAEGQVLEQVCKGLRPSQIATRHGVQISTVRTQLRAIRHKTASDSVRELVEKVSVLPPLARNLPNLWGNNQPYQHVYN